VLRKQSQSEAVVVGFRIFIGGFLKVGIACGSLTIGEDDLVSVYHVFPPRLTGGGFLDWTTEQEKGMAILSFFCNILIFIRFF